MCLPGSNSRETLEGSQSTSHPPPIRRSWLCASCLAPSDVSVCHYTPIRGEILAPKHPRGARHFGDREAELLVEPCESAGTGDTQVRAPSQSACGASKGAKPRSFLRLNSCVTTAPAPSSADSAAGASPTVPVPTMRTPAADRPCGVRGRLRGHDPYSVATLAKQCAGGLGSR